MDQSKKGLLLYQVNRFKGHAFNQSFTSDSKMFISPNSKDPDEKPHNAVFQHGLHCLLRKKWYSEKEMQL